jgi:hypothetical protein
MFGGGGPPFESGGEQVHPGGRGGTRSLVTLSGLLNVIDGVGSEEGQLFFATVIYALRSLFSAFLMRCRPLRGTTASSLM